MTSKSSGPAIGSLEAYSIKVTCLAGSVVLTIDTNDERHQPDATVIWEMTVSQAAFMAEKLIKAAQTSFDMEKTMGRDVKRVEVKKIT